MPESRRPIFVWLAAALLALVGAAGLALTCLPETARSLGRAADAPPNSAAVAPVELPHEQLFAEAGLHVAPAQVAANRKVWDALSDDDRAALAARIDRWQAIDPEDRAVLVSRYKELQRLPEPQRDELRRQAAALARFESTLGRQDLATLEGLAGTARAKYLLDLWRARQALQ